MADTQGLQRFEQWLIEQGRSAVTVRGYLQDLRFFVTWFEQSQSQAFTPRRLTVKVVEAYRQWLEQRKLQAGTANRKLTALAAYSQWAQNQKLITTIPIRGTRATAAPREPEWLIEAEQTALLARAEGAKLEGDKLLALRDWVMVVLLLNTGLRVAELCALQVSDIQRARPGDVWLQIGQGRRLPLNSAARQALDEWLAARPSAKASTLFAGHQNAPLEPRVVQGRLQVLARAAGVKATPSILRHTFAHNLVQRGVPLEQLAQLMGVKSLEVLRVYAPDQPEAQSDLAKAVEKIGETKPE